MKVYLLADIGGTNARFTLVSVDDQNVHRAHTYAVRENPTLIGALKKFLEEHLNGDQIETAAIAIAGPVLSDVVKLTNSDWVCDKEEIKKLLGIDAVYILNDFEAVAHAVTSLEGTDKIETLQRGNKSSRHPSVVMGPGTGLGVAGMAPESTGAAHAFPTEGGHVRFAPANNHEREIADVLSRKLDFVRVESLISGPGLVNLYQANCELTNNTFNEGIKPRDIVEQARQGNKLCRLVLDDFAAIFGGFASQMALSWYALGGIYLGGGVLQKMGGDFDQKRFLKRFGTNPTMSHLLAQIPVYRVKVDVPAFTGLFTFASKRPSSSRTNNMSHAHSKPN